MASRARETPQALLRDYCIAIVLAVAAAMLIRAYLIEAYRIPSPAMRPTLEAGDTIFVDKWHVNLVPWLAHAPWIPHRGDVVVFTPPGEVRRDYIKRVVGLAGDEIRVHAGRVTLNGKALPVEIHGSCGTETLPPAGATRPGMGIAPSLAHSACWEPPLIEDFGPARVPADSVFVIGDLRSRGQPEAIPIQNWGVMPIGAIKGLALWIWLSVEPAQQSAGAFPQLRFTRMFRRIQ